MSTRIAGDLLVTLQQRLAPPDPSPNLRKALKLRSTNTGKWYLQGPQFESLKGKNSYFGWLKGSSGSGKTILSAGIIDSLQQFCDKDPARSLAFFFFDFNDSAKQDANTMVKSLLSQCLKRCWKIPGAAQCLSLAASEQQLLDALRDTVESLPMPFVVLDALDECNNRDRLFEILQEMQSWGNKSLRVLVTSRTEAVDVEDALEDLVLPENRICLESDLVDEDIRTYVHERLTKDKSFRRWQRDPEIQKEIEQTLGKQACGMFRWAACQLDTLTHCLTLGKVRRTLQDLPKTLYDTYDRMIRTIDESQNGEEALKVLRWLVFARRPLTVNELLQVTGIVLEEEPPRFDKDEVLKDPRDILRICAGLVSITPAVPDCDRSDNESETEDTLSISSSASSEPDEECIRLAHFSVKEYLLSTHPCIGRFSFAEKESHDILATCCLVYLHRFEGEEWNDPECEAALPLARYAAVYWTTHARISDCQSGRQRDLCKKLLREQSPAYRSWHRFYNMSRKCAETCDLRRTMNEFPSHLFSAAGEDLLHAVHAILEDETVNIDATWESEGTSLCEASKMGYERIVKILLAKGADANVQIHQGAHALVEATRYGDKKIVQRLLDAGADVAAEQLPYGTALDVVSIRGDWELMEILLARDVDLAARGECYGQALIHASNHGHQRLVEMLLAHGAEVNTKSPSDDTALAVASNNGHVEIVEILLAHGADINAQAGIFGTALGVTSFFCFEKAEKIVETLLANGADVEIRGEGVTSPTPLQQASHMGHTKIVEMLLANGADVNAQPGWHGSAIAAASSRDHEEIIEMLEAKGAKLQEGE
ncbi:Pfs, NACHT and ankyrin domain protein [Hortaea werneckii]|uniref:Nephrocystin 3-like N-terminal domain-containing protein n=1 Tax=Hortaea werneckii EXF-2000 TaxID=1157616 RepID=A0A1Z5TL51_HORWE|nr:Pfs, NACHT and ankyrin domain protein [Hortaea werneckii]OTA36689.1 hypothetical protein BTJ68_03293 [Hortaea werneckii EXF-2000]KAI6829897.1 Pfs, NACHT and ankyrin domain protein [Hortaea werneckii]KAI6926304.1 Pfs, NACHT and ankyrin domain protein [Hortaea werneckii]KAI6933698.1 Pfs, NACHT and ankyrin domain protein [Hortaea werneckii]